MWLLSTILCCICTAAGCGNDANNDPGDSGDGIAHPREPKAGMLYFATHRYEDVGSVVDNPYVIGGLWTFYWSDIESVKGNYDFTAFDTFYDQWVEAGKKVAIRITWSTSGYWSNPQAKTPNPAWLWDEGAKYAYHGPSKTQIPLMWDPVFRQYAMLLLSEINRRYGNDPNLLFFDVTPGAETNPYRFGTIDGFETEFCNVAASDGRKYTEQLWVSTVKDWIGSAASVLPDIPLLVTLNTGGFGSANNFGTFGDHAVGCGTMVGQNGINANSYTNPSQERFRKFNEWSRTTKLFFEMVHAAETSNTGTMQGVVDAAKRIDCDYLNVYPQDVIKSCDWLPEYVSRWGTAMSSGKTWFSNKYRE